MCSAKSGSGLYEYKWKVYCASTGVLISESVLGTQNTYNIKSTPALCSDRIECVVEDIVYPLTGSKSSTISLVTGECYAWVLLCLFKQKLHSVNSVFTIIKALCIL